MVVSESALTLTVRLAIQLILCTVTATHTGALNMRMHTHTSITEALSDPAHHTPLHFVTFSVSLSPSPFLANTHAQSIIVRV